MNPWWIAGASVYGYGHMAIWIYRRRLPVRLDREIREDIEKFGHPLSLDYNISIARIDTVPYSIFWPVTWIWTMLEGRMRESDKKMKDQLQKQYPEYRWRR